MSDMPDLRSRALYAHWVENQIRYNDTDRQGHVNNVAYATYCEQGRIGFLHGGGVPKLRAGTAPVIARLELDFRAESFWPGIVEVGTRVLRMGRSSLVLGQGLFCGEACVATATSVVVLMDEATRKSTEWPDGWSTHQG